MTSTKTKVAICRAKIEKLRNEILKIQSECKHEKVKKSHGPTEGYDTVNIWYYTDFHCLDCDKYWTEDGSL